MMGRLAISFAAVGLLLAAALTASGCTPTDRDFASGGAGGQGGGCPTGFAECDANPDTVCETDMTTSLEHCGVCEHACAAALDANVRCVAGTCSIASCSEGRENCDNFYDNGCEVDVGVLVLGGVDVIVGVGVVVLVGCDVGVRDGVGVNVAVTGDGDVGVAVFVGLLVGVGEGVKVTVGVA
jgi:hypothetical protein